MSLYYQLYIVILHLHCILQVNVTCEKSDTNRISHDRITTHKMQKKSLIFHRNKTITGILSGQFADLNSNFIHVM